MLLRPQAVDLDQRRIRVNQDMSFETVHNHEVRRFGFPDQPSHADYGGNPQRLGDDRRVRGLTARLRREPAHPVARKSDRLGGRNVVGKQDPSVCVLVDRGGDAALQSPL